MSDRNGLNQHFVTLPAPCLQLVPLVGVFFGPRKDRLCNPASRLRVAPVVDQDAINHHSYPFFRIFVVSCHTPYPLIRARGAHMTERSDTL